MQQRSEVRSDLKFFHLRTRNNGVATEKGGYTVAIKGRPNGLYSVSICQCNSNQTYDERLGEKVAEQRIGSGKFFVQSTDDLVATLNTLHNKLSTGPVIRLDLRELEEAQAA